MKIQIWTVGKQHDDDLKSAITKYDKRLSHYTSLEWRHLKPSQRKTESEVRQQESQMLLELMDDKSRYLLLDERGKLWDNHKWVQVLQNHANSSPYPLVYIIGGAYGVTSDLRARLTSVSVSPLVLPHMIMRLILVEQLYRSYTIIQGTGYHHT